MNTEERSPSPETERIFRMFGLVLGAVAGVAYGVVIVSVGGAARGPALNVGLTLLLGMGGAIYGFLTLPLVTIRPFYWTETKLRVTPLPDLMAALVGLLLGLGLAALVGYFLRGLFLGAGYVLSLLVAVVFAYWGITTGLSRGREMSQFLGSGRSEARSGAGGRRRHLGHVLLDTSVIIDGRIADVVRTGFIQAVLLVPEFVLRELQFVADSPDPIRRSRGRRGLEVLGLLQTDPNVEVQITREDVPQVREVDDKLIRLAQRSGASVMTNDYNLNRVAGLAGVKVLNLNDLANALKPVVVPGEVFQLMVLKEGKEVGQGVGYLDDGTMVVLEGGRQHVGHKVSAQVTTVLQTAAGRMIFGQMVSGAESGPAARE